MTNNMKLRKTGAALAGLLALTTLFAGCGSSSSDGAGGSTGTPSAGAGASGTSHAAGTTAAAGATGAAGTTGAAGAAGGSSNASGAACGPKCTEASTCTPSVIASGLTTLTDFSTNLDSGHMFHASGDSNDWSGLFGGTWVAPKVADACAATPAANPLTESFSDGNWHVTGTIAPSVWAGAGFWFATGANCPVFDFSAYSGISFTIAGNAGPSGSVNITVPTASNTAPVTDKTSSNFTCYSNAATCAGASCSAASMTVSSISTTPQTVKLMFADLKGGAPVSSADKKEITGIGINPTIDWSGKESPYALDLTIDDLTLIP
jgi:hypothetical protein